MLNIVKERLNDGLIVDNISDTKIGDFINVPVHFKMNSYKHLMEEIETLLHLHNLSNKVNENKNKKNKDIDNFNTIKPIVNQLFSGNELLYESSDHAIIANMFDSHLYQATKSDIIDSNLTCLGQVKKIFPHGTKLMLNTTFNKINDKNIREQLLKSLEEISNIQDFSFEATPKNEITDKPVYLVEIISLYL